MRLCAVIPTHNHHRALPEIVATLQQHGLAVFIIDDGSAAETAQAVQALHDPHNSIWAQRLSSNSGKGLAVMIGLSMALQAGFSHALQVDADGQHDLAQIPTLIDNAQRCPQALVTGLPIYDDSIPTGRKIGRWVTHVWVWIETLSLAIRDSMCGFRVYPIQASLDVWRQEGGGPRMDFDTEIMVRLFWRGTPVIPVPTKVTYPPGNSSNFRLWKDNLRISWMHTRLVIGLLGRLPRFIAQGGRWTPPNSEAPRHWAQVEERGRYGGIHLLGLAFRFGGRSLCRALMIPVIAYFFATGGSARRASLAFLRRVAERQNQPAPTLWDSFRHFLAFGDSALDKVAAWSGKLTRRDVDMPGQVGSLAETVPPGQAVMLLISHFGNIEAIRAVTRHNHTVTINVLLHQKNAARFGRVLKKIAPQSQVNLIEVADMGPDTAIMLKDKIDQGEWVVIAADRIAIGAQPRTVLVPFLGTPARFPQGPFILAHLLGCPVYMVAAWRSGRRYRVRWDLLAERVSLPRQGRIEAITAHASTYAAWLEPLVSQAPRQWFNFYDFWTAGSQP
jgi:predicted LPLAT superfamily acyltransferase